MRTTLTILVSLLIAVPSFATDDSEKLSKFLERAFSEIGARSPMFEARLNIRDQYDKWDDLSDAYAAETKVLLQRLQSEMRELVDRESLSPADRLNYDLFLNDTQNRIDVIDWRDYGYPVEQMYGWQSRVPAFLIGFHKIDTVEDANAYIARLEGIDETLGQAIELMHKRAGMGVIPPKFVFAHVLSDCRNVIKGRPFEDGEHDSTLLFDFREKLDDIELDDAQKVDLINRATRALDDDVRRGYTRMIDAVTAMEAKATTDDGVWKFENGGAYYEHCLKYMTTTEMTPDQIHELGLSEVARIHAEMREIVKAVEFDGTLQEFFVHMRTSPEFYFEESSEGREAYLAGATEIINNMRDQLDMLFGRKPKAEIVVKAVEPFREKSAGKAFYESPAPDGSRPGTYYANLYQMSDMPTYQMEALAYHEGIPGHHMQRAISIEMEDLPTFRKYARYTAYTEGWALYTEYLPKEYGFYKDPYSDFGRLAMELWRACRLVVDTGMHDRKWTREKAIDYLKENTPNPEGDVVKAIERYIVMPGQATAYKIGMIKILELRESAKRELGDQFDIRAFHDLVLGCGPVPLTILEQQVDQWVADTRSAAGSSMGSSN